jgi:amidohydrolase
MPGQEEDLIMEGPPGISSPGTRQGPVQDRNLLVIPILDAEYASLEALYRHLHTHPELSGSEAQTAGALARELRASGYEVTTGVGGHGVVGVFRNGSGPVVMIRADMDALPIREQTNIPYASTVEVQDADGSLVGVMHACGHDLHMTVLAGTARVLSRMKAEWSGTLLLIGQPSEETVSGAEMMLKDGLYARFPRPDYALSLHVGPGLSAGVAGFREGIFSAGADSLDLVVRGIGGHAAHPDQACDPVVIAAQVIMALQSVVSREVPPREFAVLTVASVHGGIKHNMIPDEVMLRLNIRYYKEPVRSILLSSITRIVTGIAAAAGAPADRMPELTLLDESVPPLVNDPDLTRRVMAACQKALGEDHVEVIDPLAGSEDFGIFGDVTPPIPICYFRIGADRASGGAGTGRAAPEVSLHSAYFAPEPEPIIRTGIRALAAAVLDLLPEMSPDRPRLPDLNGGLPEPPRVTGDGLPGSARSHQREPVPFRTGPRPVHDPRR